ncbi:MAG TPA: enoyl-CoA hydratase-related protein [Syntrophorhabdaceae bacterium]|nr:enoyl-CoA hydratase-related protein [Syntrophorhabdaceae bacterium]
MSFNYSKEGHVAIFTINRPEARNAFNTQMLEDFSKAMLDFRDDPDLWVGIITGEGEEAFCGGTDAKERLPILRKYRGSPDVTPPNPLRGFDLYKPLIAAVNGLALGMGTEIVLACDIRIASENARFGLVEVTLGLIPGQGGATRLPRMIPWCRAAEMILTGAIIDAHKAEHFNLINEVVPPGELMISAKKWADRICKAGPLAVRLAKENMIRTFNMSLSDGLRLENTFVSYLVGSEDFAEGIKAFAEKRKPVYKGK